MVTGSWFFLALEKHEHFGASSHTAYRCNFSGENGFYENWDSMGLPSHKLNCPVRAKAEMCCKGELEKMCPLSERDKQIISSEK